MSKEKEKVKFLFVRSWAGMYAFVLGILALFIALFYFFTKYYS